VVLAFSLMLRDKLNATGRYKVLMTRDTDVFVELNKRREFAEHHLASLFVAVHADYANSSARGATIYSLRESVSNQLQRSARGEVGESVLSGVELDKDIPEGTEAPQLTSLLSGHVVATRIFGGGPPRSRLQGIPRSLVDSIHVVVKLKPTDMVFDAGWMERWLCDRVIKHIPGGRHAAE